MPTENEISNALKVLTEVGFENTRELYREVVKAHPEYSTPDVDATLKAGAEVRYDAVVEYDGGDALADVNTEFYERGKLVGRITCTCIPSLGRGKHRRNGFAVLTAPIHNFRDWRVSCGVNSGRDKFAVDWRGMKLEYVGYANSAPIPLIGLTAGAGYVTVF